MMLGVRRPGVTVAIQELEREGLVERKGSRIIILDQSWTDEVVERDLRACRWLMALSR